MAPLHNGFLEVRLGHQFQHWIWMESHWYRRGKKKKILLCLSGLFWVLIPCCLHPLIFNKNIKTSQLCSVYTGASLVAQLVKNLPAMQETWVWSLGWEDPLEKGMATHSTTLTWRIPWTEDLVGYSPWDCNKSDTTERLTFLAFPSAYTVVWISATGFFSPGFFCQLAYKRNFSIIY